MKACFAFLQLLGSRTATDQTEDIEVFKLSTEKESSAVGNVKHPEIYISCLFFTLSVNRHPVLFD